MSKDITTAGPSRRQIAKGAAWAVPAVTVAAAAPALAASHLPVCSPVVLEAAVLNCSTVGLLQPQTFFRVTNPAGSGCVVPAGTQLTLTTSGVAGINATLLDGINADVDLIFSDGQSPTTARDLEPGDYIDFQVIPSGITVAVLGTWTLNVPGDTARFTQTANVTIGGTAVASICAVTA